MYIYHALINALNAHTINVNLNTQFYTHVEHSPMKNNLHEVYYTINSLLLLKTASTQLALTGHRQRRHGKDGNHPGNRLN